MQSYRSHVAAQKKRNPCLSCLCKFLDDLESNSHPCQIATLDFTFNRAEPLLRQRQQADLGSILSHNRPEKEVDLQGQILVIENLSSSLVEILGTALDIDPLFFASYVHTAYRDINSQTPDLATLPSRMRQKSFVNINYHRTIVIQKCSNVQQKILRNMNIGRKVVILPKIRDTTIGLVQHSCAILRDARKRQSWLCTHALQCSLFPATDFASDLVLVDPGIQDGCLSLRGPGPTSIPSLASRLFLGGYEDFLEAPSLLNGPQSAPSRCGLFGDLAYYWKRERPECFNSEWPTLISISYYPLKVVAAEWMNYGAVMDYSIKKYEYTIGNSPASSQELDKLNSDLRSLQAWRRRSLSSLQKISSLSRFIDLQKGEPLESKDSKSLMEDFVYISESIDNYARRMESMVLVVTSLVQIVDGRRSFAETANVTRLTYMALVFVPLTFTSSLFSMNAENAPGAKNFWKYFAVAVPMTVAVFLLARPPSVRIRWSFAHLRYKYLRAPKKPQISV